MGNCCSKCGWEIKKMFLKYSTDYEVLEYDTIQRTVKFQSNYDSVENRNIKYDSMEPDVKKFRYQAPFDVIGCVLEYVSDPEVFMTVVHCSHSLKVHIVSRFPTCGRHVMFNFTHGRHIGKRSQPFYYVHQMTIKYGSNFTDSKFNLFPNLESLVIWKGENIRGRGLKVLKNLQSLGIWQCKIPGHFFKQFGKNLHTLEISDSPQVNEDDICSFEVLRNLGLKKCYHIQDWKKICEESKFYKTSLETLEIREVRLTPAFHLPLNLQVLKVYGCRNFDENMLLELLDDEKTKDQLDNLTSLAVANCQKVTGSCFNRFHRLRKLSLLWLDNLVKSDTIFDIPKLEKLKLQGCYGITNKHIMNLKRLKKLTLIEQQLVTDEAFNNLGKELVELKLVQCTNISDQIFKFVRGRLKVLKVVGCEKVNIEVLEELEISGVRIV